MTPRRSSTVIAAALAAVIAGMAGLSFASVPLYRMFCAATGYGGTPKIGPERSASVSQRSITVRFNADANPGLPWQFAPEQKQVTLQLGEEQVAFYAARNEAAEPVTGIALYNVTPDKAAKYFHKTACFCFNQQTLAPGQAMQFPVSFWVDPAIADDPNTAGIGTVTLSYTFFRSLEDARRTGALARAGEHIGALVPGQPHLETATQ